MASYVPADSLLFMEASSLPEVINGLTHTDGWKELAGPAGIPLSFGKVDWFSRLAAWTGVGPADTIVFSRMQVAATVLSVAAADGGETLNVRPRIAIVVETHVSASRTRTVIEKHVGNFARRAYGEPRVEQREMDGVHWIVWNSATSDRRIIAAMTGSLAIIGNDEAAVQACLAVRRGERPSLAGNRELDEARRRVAANNSLTFGFVSTQGAAKFFEVAAAIYVGQLSDDPKTQSLAASILPQMAKKILGSVGWSARLVEGNIEDRYFVTVANDASARLRTALIAASAATIPAAAFLPPGIYSLTRYSAADPLEAWRALSFSISSQLDPVLAVMVAPLLKASLAPYGIEDPDFFLQSVGPEIVTARIENAANNTVLIVEIRDEKALREFVSRKLGTVKPKIERLGDLELLSSTDAKRGAASFINGYLLLGSEENVRRCLDAQQRRQTLPASPEYQKSLHMASLMDQPHVVTLTSDSIPAREFIVFVANQRGTKGQPINTQELETKLDRIAYAVSEMKFVEGGIEKRTRSSFGLLGVLATQFSTKN